MRQRSFLGLVLAVLVLAALAAPAGATNVPPPPTPVPRQVNSVLKVVPFYIHGGDTVHVSGDGFNPGKRIYLLFGCPSPLDQTALRYHNWYWVPMAKGPKPDKHGSFVNFTVPTQKLNAVTQSSCGVYTAFPDGLSGDFGPDIPGSFYVMPPKTRLPKCSKQICATVRETPRRVHSGRSVVIKIRPGNSLGSTSWPGARTTITVSYPGSNPLHRSVTLDWRGWADTSFQLPSGVDQPTKAQVTATFSMGKLSGHAHDNFIIVR